MKLEVFFFLEGGGGRFIVKLHFFVVKNLNNVVSYIYRYTHTKAVSGPLLNAVLQFYG